MSKIIVNTGTLSAGGAERVLSILSKPLADAFDEVQYVMWLDAKYPDIFYEIDPRVKIVRMSQASNSKKTLKHVLWYRRYIRQERPDLVLSFMVMICFTVTVSLLFTGINQIVAERNDPRHLGRKWLRSIINFSYLSPDVKGILMQTEWNKSFFKNDKLRDKTSIIYNPVDMNPIFVGKALNTAKVDIIVSVGRLTKQKNHAALVEAFAEFHKTHPLFKLIIYGEGDERLNLISQAVALGIRESVVLPGRSRQVFKDILPARVFVMTSAFEGMSNALVEAMCLGLPCISTKVSGATDFIKDGENGMLVDNGDISIITRKMELIADNEELQKEMGKKASQLYNRLRSEKICQEWVKYLMLKSKE